MVDRDKATLLAIVAHGGVVVMVMHTVNDKSLSATSAVAGIANIAAAK